MTNKKKLQKGEERLGDLIIPDLTIKHLRKRKPTPIKKKKLEEGEVRINNLIIPDLSLDKILNGRKKR